MAASKKPTSGERERARRAARKKGAPGRSLTIAQKAQRDQLMLARAAQGWTDAEIGKEANLSASHVRKVVREIRETAPIKLNDDPVKIVQEVFEGVQQSIAGFEAIASEALAKGQYANAVGGKRGANDARGQIMLLLQMTGRLPQDLTALRHLIDLRAIAVRMLDVMDKFERGLANLNLDAATQQAVDAGVLEVRGTFNELLGLDHDTYEGTAQEIGP